MAAMATAEEERCCRTSAPMEMASWPALAISQLQPTAAFSLSRSLAPSHRGHPDRRFLLDAPTLCQATSSSSDGSKRAALASAECTQSNRRAGGSNNNNKTPTRLNKTWAEQFCSRSNRIEKRRNARATGQT